MSILTSLIRLTIEFVVITGVIILIIGFIPTKSIFSNFQLEPVSYDVPDVNQHLKNWNNVLGSKSELLLNNQIVGPESLAQSPDTGLIYAGLADGRLIEYNPVKNSIRFITRFALDGVDDCYDNIYHRLKKCGRPLGLRFESSGSLLVTDAFFGLFRVNVTTGKKSNIALGSSDTNLPSDLRGLFNDAIPDPVDESILYVSVSSTKWGLDQVPWSLVDHESTGLLLGVNLKNGKVVKLLDGLFFANGIEITSDKKSLLISECTDFSISKIDLAEARKIVSTGIIKGQLKKMKFASNLPGEPDNIRLFNGNIYVGFAITRAKGPTGLDLMAKIPIVRKAIGRILFMTSKVVDYLHENFWPGNPSLEELSFMLSSGHVMYDAVPKASAIGVLDGKTGSFKGLLGSESFAFISEALIDHSTGDLYFGSFRNKFLGRIKSKDVIFS